MTVIAFWSRSSAVLRVSALAVLSLSAASCGVTSNDETGDRAVLDAPNIIRIQSALITGADTCAAAPLSTESFSSPVMISDTTVGQADDFDLPDATNPTCTAEPSCVGTGTGSPRGIVWPGSGTGPDRAFRFQVSSAINLTATMLSTADLGLYLFSSSCSSQLSACACVSDNAVANIAETISAIQAVPGVDYYLVVDGYLDPMGSGPASSGAFDLTISETVIPVCGNDTVEGAEVCDDGNNDDCDGCRADCSAAETGCRDGFLCGSEECDDGNDADGDGCSYNCQTEVVVTPPDSGAPEVDAGSTNPSGGNSGTAGDGNGTGNEAGTGSSVDGGPESTGGSSGAGGANAGTGGTQVKGGNRAGTGGTAGDATAPAAETDKGGGGCATAGPLVPAKSAWWMFVALVCAGVSRRRNARH